MANTIKQKRGTTDPGASDLVVGELAINTTDGGVFTKTDGGTVVEVGSGGGGGGAFTYISTQTISSATSIVSFDLSSTDYDHFVIYGAGIKFTAAQSSGFQAAINYTFYDGAYSSGSPGTNRLSVRYIQFLVYESSRTANHSWAYDLAAQTYWSAGNPTSTVVNIKAEIGGKTNSNISIRTNFTDGSNRTSHSSIQSGDASNSSNNMNTMLIKCGQSTTFASGTFILYGVKNS